MANQALFGPRFDRQSQYRDRLAAQLIAEGSDSSPIQHPLQGAARLAQALAGGYIGMKQDQRYAEREKQSSEAMAKLFAPTQQFTPSAAGAGPRPGAQMQTAQPTLAELAQRAAAHPATAHLAPQFQMQDISARQAAEQRGQYVPFEVDGKVVGQRNTATGRIEYTPAGMLDQWEEAAGPGGLPGQRNKRTGEWKPADVRPVTNVNTPVNVATGNQGPQFGPIDKGYMMRQNPDGSYEQVPVKGGPADRAIAKTDAADAEGKRQQADSAAIVTQDIGRVLGLMDSAVLPTTGALGPAVAKIGGTAASDMSSLLDTIKANTAFDKLAEMRKASPTGAALGSVTERELALLASVRGSVEQSQSQEQLRRNLTRMNNLILDIVHGPGNGPARIAETKPGGQAGPRAGTGAQKPAATGGGIKFLGFE